MGYVYAPVDFRKIITMYPNAIHVMKELEAFQNQVNVTLNSVRDSINKLYRRANLTDGTEDMRADLLRSLEKQGNLTLRPLLKVLAKIVPKIVVMHEALQTLPESLKAVRNNKFDHMFCRTMYDLKRSHQLLARLLRGSIAMAMRELRNHAMASHPCDGAECALRWMCQVNKCIARAEFVELVAKSNIERLYTKFQTRTFQ